MKKIIWVRVYSVLLTVAVTSSVLLADAVAPTPKPSAVEPVGYEWGTIIGGALFASAIILTAVWLLLKFSKRVSK